MQKSLRHQLLAWVLLPLFCAVGIDTALTYQSSVEAASIVQDRLLVGSARMIAEQISFEDGSFQHQIPPAALELFQSSDIDRVFYRVTTGAGQLLSGYTDLPLPPHSVSGVSNYFFDAIMRGKNVRIVAFLQPVIGNPSALPVVVEVAQTKNATMQLANRFWLQSVGQQLLILMLASFFILFGLHRGLRPIIRLRNEVRNRKEGSLQLLQTSGIPTELRSLVVSFNDYIQRLEAYTNRRNAVVQNAAHQMRTPLAVLSTQISDASLAKNGDERERSLLAARRTLQHTSRVIHQYLTLSSTESFVAQKVAVSLHLFSEVVQKVIEDLAGHAHAKEIDLGLECTGPETVINGDTAAIREIAVNLIDNAIRYTPCKGIVTVHIDARDGQIVLIVEDNGPGIPSLLQEKVFDRFFRVDHSEPKGSGLGLAIVRELAMQCGGVAFIQSPSHGGNGLSVVVEFPRVERTASGRVV